MTDYVFKHDHPTEAGRMDLMASALDEASRHQMSSIPLQSDWTCLEIGAGNGSLSRWLAPKVPEGQVTATDLSPDFLADLSGPNLSAQKLDLMDGLPQAHYDFIFLRAVLHHIPDRKKAVGILCEALKPGGWLLIIEPDLHPITCNLPESCRPVWEGFYDWASDRGVDYTTGRQIPAMLQSHGMENISSAGHTDIYQGGSTYAEWLRVTIAEVSPSMLESGKTKAEDLAAFDTASKDPDVWHATFSFVGTRAQK